MSLFLLTHSKLLLVWCGKPSENGSISTQSWKKPSIFHLLYPKLRLNENHLNFYGLKQIEMQQFVRRGQKRGTGIIVTDCLGRVLACQSSSSTSTIDPLLAECEALLRALQLCEELGLVKVCLEGDAKNVIDLVLQVEECNTWYGSLIEDIKLLLFRQPQWSLQFAYRECNLLAPLLAKLGLSLNKERVWVEEFPHVISTATIAEIVI